MKERYQTTNVEASTLLDLLWCRHCGGPLLTENRFPLDLSGINEEFNVNLLMSCISCMVPTRHLAPDSGKIADRLLYHLIVDGLVRIRVQTGEVWVAPEGLTVHEPRLRPIRGLKTNSARTYLSQAVRGIHGVYVATHNRLHKTKSSYVLGHLKVTGKPCSCKLK